MNKSVKQTVPPSGLIQVYESESEKVIAKPVVQTVSVLAARPAQWCQRPRLPRTPPLRATLDLLAGPVLSFLAPPRAHSF
jgi:hypothetical protein